MKRNAAIVVKISYPGDFLMGEAADEQVLANVAARVICLLMRDQAERPDDWDGIIVERIGQSLQREDGTYADKQVL